MDKRIVEFIPLSYEALVPKRQTNGAAGYDIHTISSGVIPPFTLKQIKPGFKLNMYDGIIGVIFARSGLNIKNGIEIKNSYVNDDEEIVINVYNNSNNTFVYQKGMRIAQLVFFKTAY